MQECTADHAKELWPKRPGSLGPSSSPGWGSLQQKVAREGQEAQWTLAGC